MNKIKHIIRFLILFTVFIDASNYKYIVSSPLFGKLGVITVDSSSSNRGYLLKAKAKTEGMAAFLTKNRVERYLSKGHSIKGQLATDIFKIKRDMRNKKEIDEYHFDYNSSIVTKRRERWKRGVLKKDDTKVLKYFSSQDLTAIYLNIIPKILDNNSYKKSFFVVGAEKIGGEITLYTPNEKRKREELQKLNLKDAHIIIVTTDGKIFGKRHRELIMAIDDNGVLKASRLEALPVVGNLYVKRVK